LKNLVKNLAIIAIFAVIIFCMLKSVGILKIAFGLSLFLYAMKVMEDGFTLLASGKLEKFLRDMTGSNTKSLIFGFVSTALIQSSGLVSLLAISFVSASLISLAGGIGIIYGSNLGTTTGIWLIALVGFSIDIAKYSMPFVVLGVGLSLFKERIWKGNGYLFLSIGLIFYGIAFMKEGFENFSSMVNLAEYAMDGYAGAVVFAIIGVIITALLQSSHASLTLALSALATGQITYDNAIAIAIGSNIGSTATALIGSLSANIDGKRLTLAHAIFNAVTAVISIIFMWQLIAITDAIGSFLGFKDDDYLIKLALFHSLFNAIGIAIFFPNIKRKERLLKKYIKPAGQKKESQTSKPKFLNETLISTPTSAKEVLLKEYVHLFKNTLSIVAKSMNLSFKDITSDLTDEELLAKRNKVRVLDYDALVERRFTPLYDSIISFAVRANSDPKNPNSKAFLDVQRGAAECADILKDMRQIQPNFSRYMDSENQIMKFEYDRIRLQVLKLMRMIFLLQNIGEMETLSTQIGAQLYNHDMFSVARINELLNDEMITQDEATMLINDHYAVQNIVLNLHKIAKITADYGRNDPLDFTILKTEKPKKA